MKRREFVTSLVVIGCASLVPLPKFKKQLTGRNYKYIIQDDLVGSSALTPEMLENAIHHFDKLPQPTVLIYSPEEVKFIKSCYDQ